MKTQHTSGPWRISEHDDGSILGPRTGSSSPIVARIEPWFRNKKQGEHATQDLLAANARLVAAAPELLNALRDAYGMLDCYCMGRPSPNELQRITDAARAAIAKASGE